MPYVKPERRKPLFPTSDSVAQTEGELNYQITVLLDKYMIEHGGSYDWMGDCTSACENAAAEFRRRVMAPYEDRKIAENGDVYTWLPDLPDSAPCDACQGTGTIAISVLHPSNPNLDGWDTRVCSKCNGSGKKP